MAKGKIDEASGQGAVRAALAWGDLNLPARRTICMVDPGNEASFRVAEKCGYVRVGEMSYEGAPIELLERQLTEKT